jgi:putative addiction module component (TIGR02574 family)
MTKTVDDRLSALVRAVKALPDATQEALVEEFRERLSDFTDSGLTDAQRAEIDRRLADPRHAQPEQVREFFARHGVKVT